MWGTTVFTAGFRICVASRSGIEQEVAAKRKLPRVVPCEGNTRRV